jgi:restriction system protein
VRLSDSTPLRYDFETVAMPVDFLSRVNDELSRGTSPRLTVRELLDHWGAKRRGAVIVAQISRDLGATGLATVPSFEEVVWIDDEVSLVQRSATEAERPTPNEPDAGASSEIGASGVLRVRSIRAAHGQLASVRPQDTLEQAQSMMLENDYSQLAVLSGRELRGFVSWESIAKALIVNPDCALERVVVPADPPLRLDDDLLTNVPRIVERGFLFVEAIDRQIGGIVTVADLAEEFENRARPFFLLGDIERRLRRMVDRVPLEMLPSETQESGDRGNGGPRSPEDMTIGDYQHLFERPAVWDMLAWRIDRVRFVHQLDQVRVIRNDVMHFSSDPFTREQAHVLRQFVRTLQVLDPLA